MSGLQNVQLMHFPLQQADGGLHITSIALTDRAALALRSDRLARYPRPANAVGYRPTHAIVRQALESPLTLEWHEPDHPGKSADIADVPAPDKPVDNCPSFTLC